MPRCPSRLIPSRVYSLAFGRVELSRNLSAVAYLAQRPGTYRHDEIDEKKNFLPPRNVERHAR